MPRTSRPLQAHPIVLRRVVGYTLDLAVLGWGFGELSRATLAHV